MAAPLMERLRRTVEITISARLATAEMNVFGVPQALFKFLAQISLYSFVLPLRLAFIIYNSTKSSSEDTRGSLKPEEPGMSTRQRRFSPIKFASGVLGELISLQNVEDTTFDANMSFSRSRSSTASSGIARYSSSNTSVATLVEQIGPLKKAANANPKTPALTKQYGITILPDSQWATMNSTQSRRARRAIKRVKYKEEHGVPPREVNSKASKVTKPSKKNKENVKDDDKDSQTKNDQEPVKEKYNEGVRDDIEKNDQGFVGGFTEDDKGIEENVPEYGKQGVKEDFTKDDDEGVKGCATEDVNECTEAYFTGDNEGAKENVMQDDDEGLEEDLTKDDDAGEGNVPEVDNERVEENITVDDNERVTEDVYERIEEDVPEEHNEVVNEDDNEGHKKNATYSTYIFTPLTHHRTLRQRSRVNVIPSLVKGWPPVLLSESIIDRLDPVDVRIMQLECEYHMSRQEPDSGRFVV